MVGDQGKVRGMSIEDRQLVAELAGAKPGPALAECIGRFGPMVKRTAWRITGDEHLAEDVCQAVFLVLMRKAGGLKNVSLLGAWLYRVAVLAARKVVEAKSRRQRREQEAGMAAHLQSAALNRLPTGIDAAITGLPEIYRRVIVAHYLQGRSHAEVAAQLGVPEPTVRKRASLGIERLRKALGATTAGLTVAALSGALAAEAAASAAPLASASVVAIQAAAAGSAPSAVASLAHSVIQSLFWAKLKMFGIAGSVAAVLTIVPAMALLPRPEVGLVGHYALAEGQGSRAWDASASRNHGTLVGGVSWVPGRKGYALSFDGKTGYVQLSQDLNQWLGGSATMAFWINTKQVGSGYPPVCVTGVDIVAKTDDVHWGFLDESGKIGIGAGDDLFLKGKIAIEQMTARSAKPINDGQWHHVALTRDAVLGRLAVYVDGVLSATTSTGVKGLKTTPFYSIGRKEVFPGPLADKPMLYFQGLLSDVRFYNRVLAAAEIEAVAK
ncbi:hypothetical protein AYO44_05760 [Planctomycetaceae bacterium SCGC AG-212-F19]|nr:hypothetical protein AYO44_05760 [Planctomycetaceae bacterium SCGC AG-212-F19]